MTDPGVHRELERTTRPSGLEGGQIVWKPGTVTTAGVTANVVTANTDTKFCIYDNANTLRILNRLGATATVVLELIYV